MSKQLVVDVVYFELAWLVSIYARLGCGPNRSLSGSTLALGQGLDCAIVLVSWPFRSRVICLLPKGPLAEAR